MKLRHTLIFAKETLIRKFEYKKYKNNVDLYNTCNINSNLYSICRNMYLMILPNTHYICFDVNSSTRKLLVENCYRYLNYFNYILCAV